MAQTETDRDAGESGRMPDSLDTRHLVRRLLGLAVFIVLVGVAISSLPGLGTLRHRFTEASPWFLGLICLLKLGSCLSNVVAFRDVFCPSMGWRFSYDLGMAEQGTNVLVPTGGAGGLALGAWALRQGGMSTAHIARRSVAFFVLTSIPNFACAAVLGPLLLAGVVPGHAPVIPTITFTALAWLVSLLVAALPWLVGRIDPDKEGGRIETWLRKGTAQLGYGIRDTGRLFRDGRWPAILGAIGYLGFDIAAMVAGFAAFGGGVPVVPLIFGYVVGQLGGLIPLPGGIGGTDGGLIGAMVLYGAPVSQATAAVLAYRAFQLGVPAVLGTIAFVALRLRLAQAEEPAQACAALGESGSEPAAAASAS